MKSLANLLVELLWLAGAAVFAFFFLKTFLVIQAFTAVITLTLRAVEMHWR